MVCYAVFPRARTWLHRLSSQQLWLFITVSWALQTALMLTIVLLFAIDGGAYLHFTFAMRIPQFLTGCSIGILLKRAQVRSCLRRLN